MVEFKFLGNLPDTKTTALEPNYLVQIIYEGKAKNVEVRTALDDGVQTAQEAYSALYKRAGHFESMIHMAKAETLAKHYDKNLRYDEMDSESREKLLTVLWMRNAARKEFMERFGAETAEKLQQNVSKAMRHLPSAAGNLKAQPSS